MATQDVDQLASFDEAVRVFRESSWHIHGPLVTEDLADHTLRARASQTARDVYVFCQTFRVLYESALADLQQKLQRVGKEMAARPPVGASPEDWERHGEWWMNETREESLREAHAQRDGQDITSAFTVAFKALYLFMRAHQDALCGFAMLLLHPPGTTPTAHNMTRQLQQPHSPVGDFIRENVPDYEEWYFRWRKARNRVKLGTNFSTYGNWNEVGIQFTMFIPEGGGISVDVSAKVGLSDVVEALDMSSRLHDALKEQAATTAELLRGGSKD
jgi:hypothetical protein